MKKLYIIALGWLAWLPMSQASAQYPNLPVQEVSEHGGLVQTVGISSHVPTDVTAGLSSGTIAGTFAIEVYNLAANANSINCGFDLSLSTRTNSVWYGREIPPGIGKVYQVRLPRSKIYCQTQSVTSKSSATVTQLK